LLTKIIKGFWFLIFFSLTSYAIPELRIFGIPIPYILLIILFPFLIVEYTKNNKLLLFNIFFILYIFLSLILNILSKSDLDYTLRQFLYPLSTLVLANFLKEKYLTTCLFGLYLSSILIFTYGLYGFLTWNIGDPIQHTFGYFGITYLESTRNGDLVYLIPGLFLSYIFMVNFNKKVFKLINAFLFILFIFAIIANQSRGGFIVIIFSFVYLLFNKKKYLDKLSLYIKFFFFIFTTFSFFLFLTYFDQNSIQIIAERFLTIFSTNDNTVSTYNSNSDRIDILIFSLKIFLSNIFGIGITGLSEKTNGSLFHAENAFVSILVYYGFIGLFFFISSLYRIKRIITHNKSSFNKIIIILFFYFLLIYSLFNLMIDMLPFWLLLGLTSISYNNKIKNEN
jgi:hypothetical protein